MSQNEDSYTGGLTYGEGFYPKNFDCRISSRKKSITKTEVKKTS
jgi:hypothetical protein